MAIVLDPTNGITNVNGTAAAPAITGLDTDTGLYFGTNTLGLSTNGTAAITVDTSQNVGIGITSPTTKLTVGRVDSSNEGGQIDLCRSTDNTSVWAIDVYGNTSTPTLRFLDNTVASVRGSFDGSGNFSFNSGYGSSAIAYGVRAWVYVSTPSSATIGGSGNVSSVTRAAAGQYTVNFTNAMPDANYAVLLGYQNSAWGQFIITDVPRATTSIKIGAGTTGTNQDPTSFSVAIVR